MFFSNRSTLLSIDSLQSLLVSFGIYCLFHDLLLRSSEPATYNASCRPWTLALPRRSRTTKGASARCTPRLASNLTTSTTTINKLSIIRSILTITTTTRPVTCRSRPSPLCIPRARGTRWRRLPRRRFDHRPAEAPSLLRRPLLVWLSWRARTFIVSFSPTARSKWWVQQIVLNCLVTVVRILDYECEDGWSCLSASSVTIFNTISFFSGAICFRVPTKACKWWQPSREPTDFGSLFQNNPVPSGGLTLIVWAQKWGFSCKVQRRPPADMFLNESLPSKTPLWTPCSWPWFSPDCRRFSKFEVS